MIVVSGCKRSGTSTWMQILIAAGYPYIGEPFSKNWKKSIYLANPNGFYESRFRDGINFTNNPNPKTGEFIPALETQNHAIKIFPQGLKKTDRSYLHRIIYTIRHWKEYCSSIYTINAMENSYLKNHSTIKTYFENLDMSVEEFFELERPKIHPAIEWFIDNYSFIQDMQLRKFPATCLTYENLLEKPSDVIPGILDWCQLQNSTDLRYTGDDLHEKIILGFQKNNIDVKSACIKVDPSAQTKKRSEIEDTEFPFSDRFSALFDELYNCFNSDNPVLPQILLKELNRCHNTIKPYFEKEIDRHHLHIKKTLDNKGISQSDFVDIAKQVSLARGNK